MSRFFFRVDGKVWDLPISGVSGSFTREETVTGGTSGATGVVLVAGGTSPLKIRPVSGTFQNAETVTGGTSAATATATGPAVENDNQIVLHPDNPYADAGDNLREITSVGISKDYGASANFNTSPADDMYDIALRFQTSLRSAGATDALVNWRFTGTGGVGNFQIVSPYRGAGTEIISIYSPSNGDTDLTAMGDIQRPFYDGPGAAAATKVAGSGSPTTATFPVDERWDTAPAPGQAGATIDSGSMPVLMQRTSLSPLTFEVNPIEWKARLEGTSTTNPAPAVFDSGYTISDVAIYDNRFVIAAGPHLAFSQSGDLYNFYQQDIQTLVDSDRIDLTLGEKASNVDFIVPFRDTLVLFTTGGQQFELTVYDNGLSPSNAAFVTSTSYDTLSVRPAVSENTIHFASREGGATRIREYRYDERSVGTTAEDITAHVERLLPDNLRTIVASSNASSAVAIGTDTNDAYVYKSAWVGNERVQSAWFPWEFDANDLVVDIATLDSDLWILRERSGVFALESVPLSREIAESGWNETIHLDRKTTLTGVYSAGPNTTAFTLPTADTTMTTAIKGPGFGAAQGEAVTGTVVGSTLTVTGNFAGSCIVGRPIVATLVPTRPFVRLRDGTGIPDGAMQVREVVTHHNNSGAYTMTATVTGRATRTASLTTDPNDPEDAGFVRGWFGGNAKDLTVTITNLGARPFNINMLQWYCDYSPQAQRASNGN